MSTNLLEPGQKIKPIIDVNQAKELVEKLFHFKVIKIIEIESYDDRNYLIELESDHYEHGKQFVVKITNSLDTSVPGLMEAVNEITNYVKLSTNFKVPYPIADCDGQLVSRIRLSFDVESDDLFAVRLLAFVSGTIMNKVDYTEDILFRVGKSLGTLTMALKNYSNRILMKRETIWSLLNVSKLKDFLFAVDDNYRSLIADIIRKFEQQVMNDIDKLAVSIIHGDFNEQNIVLEKLNNSEEKDKWSVYGIIDFADSHQAPTIFDLAILCCYITLDSQLIDPIKAPAFVISGYQSVIQISEQEWEIIPICIMARLAQSLTLGAYSYRNDKGNEYILSSAKKGWSILERLTTYEEEQLKQMWQMTNNDTDDENS